MQYARKLRKGDKVAIVSLSSGMLGEEFCSHNIEIGVKRLKKYGLEPVFMPNALKGIEYLQTHPASKGERPKRWHFWIILLQGLFVQLVVMIHTNFCLI
ncbi:MAG: hypothetical protein ACLU8S_02685 [Coprococcus phoceensis]